MNNSILMFCTFLLIACYAHSTLARGVCYDKLYCQMADLDYGKQICIVEQYPPFVVYIMNT